VELSKADVNSNLCNEIDNEQRFWHCVIRLFVTFAFLFHFVSFRHFHFSNFRFRRFDFFGRVIDSRMEVEEEAPSPIFSFYAMLASVDNIASC
jgi:hypothetical protein